MHPNVIPPETRKNPIRSAECKVFDELKNVLPDEYHVFYSSPWLGTTALGEEVDGEVDFTIAHPEKGLLAIEVKGGRIEIEHGTKDWYSTDRNQIKFKIKNPVQQARSGKHQLLKKLSASQDWTSRFIRARHSVLLPDVRTAPRDLGADMPLSIFGFASDMNKLLNWVENRMAAALDNENEFSNIKELGTDGINALVKILTRGIQLQADIKSFVHDDIKNIEYLSEDQYQVLDTLMANRGSSQSVGGAAGTGKSIIALQAASLRAEENDSVLLVCYNSPLSRYLSDATREIRGIDVHTFDSLLRKMAGDTYIVPDNNDDKSRILLELVDAHPSVRYDAIIIDEGQDFESDWLEALELLLHEPSKNLFVVFYDSNQRLYNRSIAKINALNRVRIPLRRNFRNTKKILKLAERFYENPEIPIIPAGPNGEQVGLLVSEDVDLLMNLRVLLGKLITELGFLPEQISVLFQTAEKAKSATLQANSFGRFATTNATERKASAVVVDSVRRFKGLESDVVVLCLSEVDLNNSELMYVACTRAKGLLWVIGPREIEKFLFAE